MLTLLCAVCAGWIPAAAQTTPDIQAIVSRVGARVAEYYRRAQRLVCTETATVLSIQSDWSPVGMARTVESELHLELNPTDGDGEPGADVIRDIRRINGRAPRDRDKTDRQGCTDPNPLSPEPLEFLLSGHRADYQFTSIRERKDQGRTAIVIGFKSVHEQTKPELIDHADGHDDCFDWTGPLPVEGRVWVDAQSYDVLRVERHTFGPVSIRVPDKLQQEYGFGMWVVLDGDDLTMNYRPVSFSNPDEVLILPSSIDERTMVRDGLQSARRTVTYSDYRRFLTNGRIIKDEW